MIPEIESFYLENYIVSPCGRVYSLEGKNQVRQSKATRGYFTVSLYNCGTYKTFYIHRLVAMTFIPNPENKPLVNHKDGNKENNAVNNLEWCTHRENSQHSVRHLKKEVGENHSRCRLPNSIVLGIIRGEIQDLQFHEISKQFGITIQHLKNIKAGRKRKSIQLFS